MCFSYFCTYTITFQNNAYILNFRGNLLYKTEKYSWCISILGGWKLKIPSSFQMRGKNQKKKNCRKVGIFTQNKFCLVVTQILRTVHTWNFRQMFKLVSSIHSITFKTHWRYLSYLWIYEHLKFTIFFYKCKIFKFSSCSYSYSKIFELQRPFFFFI